MRNAVLLPEFADADYFNSDNDDTTPRNSDSESEDDDYDGSTGNTDSGSKRRTKMSFRRQRQAYTRDLFPGQSLYTSRIPRDLPNKFSRVRENLEQQLVKKQIIAVFIFVDNREFLQLEVADLVKFYTARGIKVFCCSAVDNLILSHNSSGGAGTSDGVVITNTTAKGCGAATEGNLSARLATARSNSSNGDVTARNKQAGLMVGAGNNLYKNQAAAMNEAVADIDRHVS